VARPRVGAANGHERGANTLVNAAAYAGGVRAPFLQWLGLGNIALIRGVPPATPPAASHGRALRATPGRDLGDGLDELLGGAIVAVAAAGHAVHCVGTARVAVPHERPKHVHVHTAGARPTLEQLSDLMMKERDGLFMAAPRVNEVPDASSPFATARALERLDDELERFIDRARDREDLLVLVTSLGGNDTVLPVHDGAAREFVPILAYAPMIPSGIALGDRASLADVGATAAEVFGACTDRGQSFFGELLA